VLDAGDMLYLPPGVAHDGVAIDACTTYSIGFRAPSAQELVTGFLDWLSDRVVLDGRYRDPVAPTRLRRIGAPPCLCGRRVVHAGMERRAIAPPGASLTGPNRRSVRAAAAPPPYRAFATPRCAPWCALDSRERSSSTFDSLFINGGALDRPGEGRAIRAAGASAGGRVERSRPLAPISVTHGSSTSATRRAQAIHAARPRGRAGHDRGQVAAIDG
jgi:50S ribosomal protein L16 3-hydroxylase